MLNFAVGPVMIDPEIREIGAEEVPYFRTPEFSALMKDSERMMLTLTDAPAGSRAVFMTASGTGSMEAAVIGLFTPKDRVLVVNGGSFGARFVQICGIHGIPCEEIRPARYHGITEADLAPFAGKGFTGFLVNCCETSTGVLYDMEMIGRFCRENGILLVADGISSFLADPFSMKNTGAGAFITDAQKTLALPPGVSIIVFSPAALARIAETDPHSLYFDLRDYLKNMERGQTPFTPAVGILIQMHRRLEKIIENGGAAAEIAKTKRIADDFLIKLKKSGLPLMPLSRAPSNAVTALHPTGKDRDGKMTSARRIFDILKDEYGITICPSGGDLADYQTRIGHLGYLHEEDNDALIEALTDLHRRGIL